MLDTRGENNNNWKPKVEWSCPICKKTKLFTPNKKQRYETEGRTCSLPCGRIQGGMKLRERSLLESTKKLISEKKSNVPLTKEHKENISIGLRSSQKFADAQKSKDRKGEKNSNWREKVEWMCPVCGTIKLVTVKQKEEKERRNISCSKKCGYIKMKQTTTGQKRPGTAKYMHENNPMKNPESVIKMATTLKASYANGDLDEQRKIISETTKRMHREGRWAITDEGRESISERMTLNNPMKNPETAEKISVAQLENYRNGTMVPPKIYCRSRYFTGDYIDSKGRKNHYASGWELTRMQFLDSCLEIEWQRNKTFRIPYVCTTGKTQTYFPDFIIKFEDKIIVEEVGTWMPDKKEKIPAATAYFMPLGIKFIAISKENLSDKTWI